MHLLLAFTVEALVSQTRHQAVEVTFFLQTSVMSIIFVIFATAILMDANGFPLLLTSVSSGGCRHVDAAIMTQIKI